MWPVWQASAMKTLRVIAILSILALPAGAGLVPFSHTTTLGTGNLLLTGDFSHNLDNSDGDMVGLRVAYSPADHVNVIAEVFGPNSFDDLGFAGSVMGYLDGGDMPFNIQLRAGVEVPAGDGNAGVLFEAALVDTYRVRGAKGLSLYGAWGAMAFIEVDDNNSWIETRFAAGLRYLFQGQGVALFMEAGELVDTYVTAGLSVYL